VNLNKEELQQKLMEEHENSNEKLKVIEHSM
jgi:hypothetical protein